MKLNRSKLVLCSMLLASGLFVSATSGAETNGSPVRLAIISESAASASVADLLTVELSSKPRLQLLERAEIEKVYREQGLSAANRDYVKLGQVLGADGLLLLTPVSEGANQFMQARLVAVKPGVVLEAVRTAWPISDATEWARWLANHFDPLFPKLGVLAKDALPMSVVNLHAATQSSEELELERQLTVLSIERLTHERELFVLERRRMELLSAEKELKGLKDSSFWNGSYLLEGVVDRDGYSKERMTVHARLVPPAGGTPIELAVEGPRGDAAGVVEKLTGKILESLKRDKSPTAWKPEAEAQKYFEEGKWAMQWGMIREAQSAFESSWALGGQSKDLAELRIRAWRESGVNECNCNIHRDTGQVVFGRPFKANYFDGTQIRFSSPPDRERFADMVHALSFFEQGFNIFIVPQPTLDKRWLELGNSLLNDTTAWLRQYYFTVEARAGLEDQISNARNLASKICAAIQSHPDYTNADKNFSVLGTRVRGVAFWAESPEQAVTVYRGMIQAGEWPKVRSRFLNGGDFLSESQSYTPILGASGNMDRASPPLAGWTWENRRRAPAVWEEFVGEMCNSTNPLTALEGNLIRCSSAWKGEEFEQRLRELLDAVWKQHAAIDRAGLLTGWLGDLDQLVSARLPALEHNQAKRIETEIWKSFDARIKDEKVSSEARAKFETVKNYFKTQQSFDFFSFSKQLQTDFDADQARELLPLVKDYQQRLTTPGQTAGQGHQLNYWFGQLENKLNAKLTPSPVNAPLPTSPQVTSHGDQPSVLPSSGSANPAQITAQTVSRPVVIQRPTMLTNLLHGARFWQPQLAEVVGMSPEGISVQDVCWREGRLWADVRYITESDDRAVGCVICGIDPDTFQTEFVRVDVAGRELQSTEFNGKVGERVFEIHNGCVYVNVAGAVRRYSLRTKQWETLSLPVEGRVWLSRIGERLYLTTANSILVLDANGAGAQILTSNRRRPPVSSLDSVSNFGLPPIFTGTNGEIRTYVAGKVWSLSVGSKDWVVVAEQSGGASVFENGVIFALPPSISKKGHLWGLFGGQTTAELLLEESLPRIQSGMAMTVGRSSREDPKLRPVWRLPSDTRIRNQPITMDGERLWSFTGSLAIQVEDGRPVVKDEGGHHGVLVCFDRTLAGPFNIPLWLDCPLTSISKQALQGLVGMGGFGAKLFRTTPKGLVLTRWHLPGFWLIPRRELEARCAEEVQRRRVEKEAREVRLKKMREALLKKFDRNRNGKLDSDETEAMIDDRDFLELKLDEIDDDQNGQLDASELAFFDANQNRQLEPREFAGIQTFLGILAEEILSDHDQNGDGQLDKAEVRQTSEKTRRSQFAFQSDWQRYDLNHDNSLSREELFRCLLRQTMADLAMSGSQGGRMNLRPQPRTELDATNSFRAAIENYWKNPLPPPPLRTNLPTTGNPNPSKP